MRFSAFLGGVLALAMGNASYGVVHQHMAQPVTVPVLRDFGARRSFNTRPSRPTRMQAHTGAGGPGMHRRWKRVRASGRA